MWKEVGSILTRDVDIANLSVRPSVSLSVCLSVTFRYHEILTGSPPMGALNTGGV